MVEKNDAVFIISPCPNDAEYVSTLLHNSGYRCYWLSDPSMKPRVDNAALESEDAVATIVCHRKVRDCQSLSFAEQYPGQCLIILSDCESEQTVVSVLNNGAHYFFSLRESSSVLQARLEAALRNSQYDVNRSFRAGNLYFDTHNRSVTRNGKAVELTPKEFDFAYYLFSHRERIVCNSELMTSIWSLPPTMDTRRIDTAACRIRKKLLLDDKPSWILKRLRSIGYRLIPIDDHGDTCQQTYEKELRSATG